METTNKQPTQTSIPSKDWIKQELQDVGGGFDGVRKPSLVLEENKITSFEIDLSEGPFPTYRGEEGIVKKMIPVIHNGEKKTFWINVKNPVYRQLLKGLDSGKTSFKVTRIGSMNNTRYNLLEE